MFDSSTAKKSHLQDGSVPVSSHFVHFVSVRKRFETATVLFCSVILSSNFGTYNFGTPLHFDKMNTDQNQTGGEASAKTEELKHQLQENMKETTAQLEETIGEAEDQAKSYTHGVSEKTEEMKKKVVHTAKSVMSQAQEATESATGQTGPIKDKLIESTEGLLGKAKQMKDKVLDMAEAGEGRK